MFKYTLDNCRQENVTVIVLKKLLLIYVDTFFLDNHNQF